MNGNELANEFRSSAPTGEILNWCHKAQAALRLQQTVNQALAQKHLSAQGYIVRLEAEIAALKEQLDTSNKAYMWLEETLYEYKRKRDPSELIDWADAEEEAQRDNEQFFKDLKAGKISLKPKD